MISHKQIALTLPAALLFTTLSHSAPRNDEGLFGCASAFGSTGQKTWLVGLDLKQGNLLTTQLTTNHAENSEINFGAATVSIRNHIIGVDKSEQISANDPLTFCKDLNISVGSQLQLHWQGKTTAEVIVQGGGEPQMSCYFGHINDPFTNSLNPFFACTSQGVKQASNYDLISEAFKKMGSPKVIEKICGLASKEHNLDYSTCLKNLRSLPALYPFFATHVNSTLAE